MDTGVTPLPVHIADIRSRSVSKHAQQSWPKFRIMPRGVRLSAGSPRPVVRASSTEEKNGKSASTNSAHVASPRSPPVAGPDGSAAEAATANRYNTKGRHSALERTHLAGQTVNFIRAVLSLLLGRIDTRSFPCSQSANEIEEEYQIAS